jgi:hypothetical protein
MKFKRPAYTTIPNEMIDTLMAQLSGAEYKVLTYVARRTFGFHRDSTRISFTQLCTGYVTREGHRLDHGTGLHRSTVQCAVDVLETKGYLVVRRNKAANGALLSNTYTIMIEDDNAPGGVVAGDTLEPISPMREIGIDQSEPVRTSRIANMRIIGIGEPVYKEEKEILERKSIGVEKQAGYKKAMDGLVRCGDCCGYGVRKPGFEPFAWLPVVHAGTLAQVRILLLEQAGVLCTCDVGKGWKTLLADAELPMERKAATK